MYRTDDVFVRLMVRNVVADGDDAHDVVCFLRWPAILSTARSFYLVRKRCPWRYRYSLSLLDS